MATFLICTDGTNGDVHPFLRLARGLVERGHRAVVLSHEPYRHLATATGVGYVAIDSAAGYANQLAQQHLLIDALAGPDNLAEYYERSGLFDQLRIQVEAMGDLIGAAPVGEVVAVGRHTTGLAPLLVGEALGVPTAWLSNWPSQHPVLELTARVFAAGIAGRVDGLRAGCGLPPVTDWSAWLGSADLMLGLWPDWFDDAGAPSGLATSGFVLNDDAETGPVPIEVEWLLDAPVGPVLVCGGSSRSLHPEWYGAALAAASTIDGRETLVVCRHRDLLPDRLPDGAHWFPELPFASVMPRVAAIVHHGGIGTTARALASATPQLILAYGTDRPDNARRVRRLGAGTWLPPARWGPEHLGPALAGLLTVPPRPTPPLDSAASIAAVCRHLESLVPTGQAMTRSATAGAGAGAGPGGSGRRATSNTGTAS